MIWCANVKVCHETSICRAPSLIGETDMVRYMRWDEVQNEDLRPGLSRRCVHGEQLTVARVLLKKGIIIPEHSHVNEQVTYILDGCLRFHIDGHIVDVRA